MTTSIVEKTSAEPRQVALERGSLRAPTRGAKGNKTEMSSSDNVLPCSEINRLARSSAGSDVLLLSMRRIAKLVAFCMVYEFEDVIADVTEVDRVDVDGLDRLERSRRVYKSLRLGTGSTRIARALAPPPSAVELQKNYDLFFPAFNNAYELYALSAVPDWRKRSRIAACYVSEIVDIKQVPKYLLELLRRFDHIFVADSHAVDGIRRISGRPCTYLPLAADVIKFAPYPHTPERSIDVCSVGRRSEATHQALLAGSAERGFFYHYDTVEASGINLKQRTFRVQDAREHRMLLASLLKRSRYCFAYRGLVNDPEVTNGREDMSARFYEASAAGAVMLGQPANIPEFWEQFDWPDVVIDLPYGSADVMKVIDQLDRDPARVARIRRANVSNAARRHDWLYRLWKVYETLGLQPTQRMLDRRNQLESIAAQAESDVR